MNTFILLVAIVSIALAAPTLATDFVVGDESGWTLGLNYTAWAEGKQFYVGDKLIFNYKEGAHNVHKVDGAGFRECLAPLTSVALTSGNDVIPLATPGRKWYICGIGKHCADGNMKFLITVLPQMGPSPAPAPSPSSSTSSATYRVTGLQESFGLIIAAFGTFLMSFVV
ncbi:hypothetical protein Leryth_026175 [Lithospermum erythrorhizon]|nr:hypothetical protein Leryth_026175 [Lithospermum erythrorhizon]